MIKIYEKLGNYALDISKYVLTGIVIASFFKDMEGNNATLYMLGVFFSALFLIIALTAYHLQNNKEKKTDKKKKK